MTLTTNLITSKNKGNIHNIANENKQEVEGKASV